MQSSKLIIAISELWTDKQLSGVKNGLLRGFEEINKKIEINELIAHLKTKETRSEIYEVEVLNNVSKVALIEEIKNSSKYQSLLILYVGPISTPLGHWLLCDGIVSSSDIIPMLNDVQFKLFIATMMPCDDWLAAEKKCGHKLSVCSYDTTTCCDPIAIELNEYVDEICQKLSTTACSIKGPHSLSFLKAADPSVCGFLDQSCSAMPCLVLIDGFTMLFNVGYGRNPEMRHQLKYIAQVDAALLSHVSCNNILALSCSAQDPDSVKINHLFLPYGLSGHDKVSSDIDNPFTVDLHSELTKVISGYSDRGTSVSNLSIKAKTGTTVTASQVKPIQLYHKIGYGSLDLIPLAPFEDDSDVKKFADDFKKGKYVNEGQVKHLPLSLSVLLIWRPFSHKVPVKRFLYIGPKSQLRKNLPSVASTLYNTIDCLKQADTLSGDTKKSTPRKSPGTGLGAPKAAAPKVNGVVPSADKPSRPATASDAIKKHPAPSLVPVSDKPQRPATATVPSVTLKTKEVAAPKRQVPKPKTDEVKKSEPVKAHDMKKPEAKKTEIMKVHEVKKSEPVKAPMPKKTEPGSGHDMKKGVQKIAHKTDARHMIKKPEGKIDEHHNEVTVPVVNGDNEHSKGEMVTMMTEVQDGDVIPDDGKLVAVGTVECAITEHGEADFCDDSPEEISADQMKQMGLYGEDDEERSSAGQVSDTALAPGTDLSQLPMEDSMYNDSHKGPDWAQPLHIPMPAREPTSALKKPTKCASPIHVDCVCVPSDLELEDLRCLFNHVRFSTGFLQLDRCGDLAQVVDLLIEEWGAYGEGTRSPTTVLPSLDDESSVTWVRDNSKKLEAAKVTVAPALCRCSILIGGESGDDVCLGFRCDL